MSYYSTITDVREADLVITVKYDGTMKVIKNRDGETGKVDMVEVLEMLLPYQPEVIHSPIRRWIQEIQSYLKLKVFW